MFSGYENNSGCTNNSADGHFRESPFLSGHDVTTATTLYNDATAGGGSQSDCGGVPGSKLHAGGEKVDGNITPLATPLVYSFITGGLLGYQRELNSQYSSKFDALKSAISDESIAPVKLAKAEVRAGVPQGAAASALDASVRSTLSSNPKETMDRVLSFIHNKDKTNPESALAGPEASVSTNADRAAFEKLHSEARAIQSEASRALEQSHVRLGDARGSVESMLKQYKAIDEAYLYGPETRQVLEAQKKFVSTGLNDKLRSADIKARTGTMEEILNADHSVKNSKIFLAGSQEAKLAHDYRLSQHTWEQNVRTGRLENNIDNLVERSVSKTAFKNEIKGKVRALNGLPEMTAADLTHNRGRIDLLEKILHDPSSAQLNTGDFFHAESAEAKTLAKFADSHAELIKAEAEVQKRNMISMELESLTKNLAKSASNLEAAITPAKPPVSLAPEFSVGVSSHPLPALASAESTAGFSKINPELLSHSVDSRALCLSSLRSAGKTMAIGLGAGLAGQCLDNSISKSLGLSEEPNEFHALGDTVVAPLLLQAPIPIPAKLAAVGAYAAISRVDSLVKALSMRH